jgi:hypothetical protein
MPIQIKKNYGCTVGSIWLAFFKLQNWEWIYIPRTWEMTINIIHQRVNWQQEEALGKVHINLSTYWFDVTLVVWKSTISTVTPEIPKRKDYLIISKIIITFPFTLHNIKYIHLLDNWSIVSKKRVNIWKGQLYLCCVLSLVGPVKLHGWEWQHEHHMLQSA